MKKNLRRNADLQDLEFRARFCEKHICYGGKGGSSAPPYQNPTTAAAQDYKSQMVSQSNPLGSRNYSADPNAPSGYRLTDTLNSPANQTLDTLLANWNTMANKAQGQQGNIQSGPMDLQSVQDVSNRAYEQQTGRLDPQWALREQQLQTGLRNQGLVPGGEAYTNSMRDFGNQRNDAYTQARTQADATMPTTLGLAQSIYNQPLNYYNALGSGAQMQMPSFGTPIQASNTLGATNSANQWNQYQQGMQNQQANSFYSGLFGLGSAGIGAYGAMNAAPLIAMSDRRLKSNIKRVGMHLLGIGIYEYEIFGKRNIGVMADEVLQVNPAAVLRHPSGFLMVNYGAL